MTHKEIKRRQEILSRVRIKSEDACKALDNLSEEEIKDKCLIEKISIARPLLKDIVEILKDKQNLLDEREKELQLRCIHNFKYKGSTSHEDIYECSKCGIIYSE